MTSTIRVNVSPLETRIAFIAAFGRVDTFKLIRKQEETLGALYRGRVVRTNRTSQLAFVDIGDMLPVVIPFKESTLEPVKEGSWITLQIKRLAEPGYEKGMMGTRDWSIGQGPFVYQPLQQGIKYSKRLSKEDKEAIAPLMAGKQNILVRSEARAFSSAQRQALLADLQHQVAHVHHRLAQKTDIGCVFSLSWQEHLIQSCAFGVEILVDEIETYHSLIKASSGRPDLVIRYQASWREEEEEAWEGLFHRSIVLPGGGRLAIDEGEALTSIDINAESSTTTWELLHEVSFKEIAHQIMLRDLTGMIVIDPAGRIKHDAIERRLKETFAQALQRDKRAHRLYGWSLMGLFEMTRARQGPSLPSILMENQKKTLWTKSAEIMRMVMKAYKQSSVPINVYLPSACLSFISTHGQTIDQSMITFIEWDRPDTEIIPQYTINS